MERGSGEVGAGWRGLGACATGSGEFDDSHGGAAGDLAGLGSGEVGVADEVGEHVGGGGEGLGGDEACPRVVDLFERFHHGLEFGKVGPLGELAGACEHLAGEVVGGDGGVEEELEGGAEGGVVEGLVKVRRVAAVGMRVCFGRGDHAEKLHAGGAKARGKVGMYHEFARAGGRCGQIYGANGSEGAHVSDDGWAV